MRKRHKTIFCEFCAFLRHFFYTLRKSDTRFACIEAFAAQNFAPDFWLKRHVIVFAAVVADDFKFFRCITARCRLFRAAFRASLRRHHIALVKNFLIFFREKKNFLALNTRDFNIRHRFFSPLYNLISSALLKSLSQTPFEFVIF